MKSSMTREQIDAIKRKEAREVLEGPMPLGIVVAVEQAMNLEWWRGYYAALARADRMAAAPDMYDALKSFVKALDSGHAPKLEAYDAARAALVKAEGR